ncbi:MAG: tetratricopeptide repeat protein [Bacteroidota bacterium]
MLLAQVYLLSNRTEEGEYLYKSVINAYDTSGNKKAAAQFWYRLGCTLGYQQFTSEAQHNKMISAFDHSIRLYHETGDTPMEIAVGIQRVQTTFKFGMPNLEEDLKILADKSIANGRMYLPNIYVFHAIVNRYKGNLNNALAYSLPALQILREMGDTVQIANYYGEIALEYGELGRSAESIAYYKKCLDGRERHNVDQYVIYRTATLMTSEMIKNKEAAQAFGILKSLEQRNPPHGEIEKAIIEHGMANCLAASGKFTLAEKYYLSMIKGYQQNERNQEILLIAYFDVVKFLTARHEFTKAEAYYDQIMSLSTSVSIARKSETELFLFKIDSARSRFPQAIKHYQLFKNYNDSIFNKVKSEQIEELHVRYSSEQKDQNIALLTKQTELQQANLRQSAFLRNSLLAGTTLLVLLLSVLYSRYRLKTGTISSLKNNRTKFPGRTLHNNFC